MSQPQQVRLVVVCWTLDPGSYKPPGAPVVWGESSCGELSGLHIEAPKALRMKKRADWSHPASTAIWGNWSQLSKFVFHSEPRGAQNISKSRHILGICVVWETGLTSNRMTLEQITQLQFKANVFFSWNLLSMNSLPKPMLFFMLCLLYRDSFSQ